MPGRCATCKWWCSPERGRAQNEIPYFRQERCVDCPAQEEQRVSCPSDDQDPEDFNADSTPTMHGLCLKLTMDGRETAAFTEDMSGLYAAVRCRADFGCVLHEGKPLEDKDKICPECGLPMDFEVRRARPKMVIKGQTFGGGGDPPPPVPPPVEYRAMSGAQDKNSP